MDLKKLKEYFGYILFVIAVATAFIKIGYDRANSDKKYEALESKYNTLQEMYASLEKEQKESKSEFRGVMAKQQAFNARAETIFELYLNSLSK